MMIKQYQIENLQVIKEIIYTLYELYKDNLQSIIANVKRNELIILYNVCKTFETDNFISYYKKSIVNKFKSTFKYETYTMKTETTTIEKDENRNDIYEKESSKNLKILFDRKVLKLKDFRETFTFEKRLHPYHESDI